MLIMNPNPALATDGCSSTDAAHQPAAAQAQPAATPALAVACQQRLPATTCVQYDSRQLFGDALEVHIQHASQLYRLRVTSMGKLILTK